MNECMQSTGNCHWQLYWQVIKCQGVVTGAIWVWSLSDLGVIDRVVLCACSWLGACINHRTAWDIIYLSRIMMAAKVISVAVFLVVCFFLLVDARDRVVNCGGQDQTLSVLTP